MSVLEPSPPPAVLFGVPIDAVSMDGALQAIERLVVDGRASGRTHRIGTVNVDFLANALADARLLKVLQMNSLNIADGLPVVWASKLTDQPLPERVAGADLVLRLVEASSERGWKVNFFGGSPEVADRARARFRDRWPAARVTIEPGPMIRDVDDVDHSVLEQIAKADPDILCVALGNPKQEFFMAAHGATLGCPLMIGVGGSLDMMVGRRRRAPSWIQRVGAEWAYRLVQEPTRLGPRYARDARVFLPAIGRDAMLRRRYQSASGLELSSSRERLVARSGGFDTTEWREGLSHVEPETRVLIDLGDVASISPDAHAALIMLLRLARRNGLQVERSALDESIRECLRRYGTLGMVSSLACVESREVSG